MMAKLLFTICLLSVSLQINAQIISSPISFINPRPYTDALFDIPRNYVPKVIETPRNYLQPQSKIIAESPFYPYNNIPSTPSTTVITDCTPSVCQNLADTISLLIVSNLLQNSLGDLKNVRLASPLQRNSLPRVDIGMNRAFLENPALTAAYPELLLGPNLGSKTSALIAAYPELLLGPYLGPKTGPLVNPNLPGPNIASSNVAAPRPVGSSPNVPNGPSNAAMLSSLLKMLGNVV